MILYFINIQGFIYHCISDGYLRCFQFSALTNNVIINILVHVSWYIYMYFLWIYIHGSTIPGSQNMCMFNFSRRCQIVFQSGCAKLPSHQQNIFYQHWVFVLFFHFCNFARCGVNSICIFFVTNEKDYFQFTEHLFFVKCQFKSLAYCFDWIVCLSLTNWKEFFVYSAYKQLLVLKRYLLPPFDLPFHFLNGAI